MIVKIILNLKFH